MIDRFPLDVELDPLLPSCQPCGAWPPSLMIMIQSFDRKKTMLVDIVIIIMVIIIIIMIILIIIIIIII